MNYADYTRNTKEPFKKMVHGRRLRQAAALLPLSADMKVLDYGCGDGGFFEYLEKQVPKENLFGFDPRLLGEMTFKGATTYDNSETLIAEHSDFFDVVYCMEVCEHLNDAALSDLFRNIKAIAKSNATVVFGVPIETGPSGFIKNIYRWLHKGRQNATLGRAFKSLFGLQIPRTSLPEGWISSHIGFDTRAFSRHFRNDGFEVVRRNYLPAPILRGALNNEVYFICKLHQAD